MWRGVDTSKLLFDISKKDIVRTLKWKIPEFKEYKGELDPKETFRYIVLMYDLNSDLWRMHKDYVRRKYEAARLAGFTPNKRTGKFTEKVTSVILGQDPEVNKLAVAYIAQFAMPELVELHAMLVVQERLLREMMDGDLKANMDLTMTRVSERIRELTRKIFYSGDKDEVMEMRHALYEHVRKEELPTPEFVAKVLSEEGDLPPDYNPYGDYKVDEMRFVGDEEEVAKRLTKWEKKR